MIRHWFGMLVVALAALAAIPSAAAPVVFTGALTSTAEVPPNASPGTGPVIVSYDPVTEMMTVSMSFSGLLGITTMAHIHCCVSGPGVNAGIATPSPSFPGFPVGVSSGSYQNTFDMADPASYNATFLFNHGDKPEWALAALLDGMGRGGAYFNIHTSLFPGGEIRADLYEQPIFADGFE